MLVSNSSKEKSGVRRILAIIGGLIKAAITNAATPMMIMKTVSTSGIIGKFLMVKRKCGCKKAKSTIKRARYMRWGVKIEASKAKAKAKQ